MDRHTTVLFAPSMRSLDALRNSPVDLLMFLKPRLCMSSECCTTELGPFPFDLLMKKSLGVKLNVFLTNKYA